MAKISQPTRAPNKALYLTDYARSAWDIGALSATLPALTRAPRGDGHAVLVIPGLGASDMCTLILRRFLSTLGYATYGWELGRNIGPTARVVRGLPERLHEFRARHEECFQQAKGEAGLDHYQVRSWRAWYAHITLSTLALAWLAASRAEAVKKGSAPATRARSATRCRRSAAC